MLKMLLTLLMIQSVRIVLLQALLQISQNVMLYHSFLLIPIGITLLLIKRPSLNSLGLGTVQMKRVVKIAYILCGILIIVLVVSTPSIWLEPSRITVISIIETVVIYPVFEELLFRGYLWKHLERCYAGKRFAGAKMITLNTLLFGLWHLGYIDVICMRTQLQLTSPSLLTIMLYKVLTGMVFGLLTGVARWRLKSTYGSILVHSFFNIFGR